MISCALALQDNLGHSASSGSNDFLKDLSVTEDDPCRFALHTRSDLQTDILLAALPDLGVFPQLTLEFFLFSYSF